MQILVPGGPRNLTPFKFSTEAFLRDFVALYGVLTANSAISEIVTVVDDQFLLRTGGVQLEVPLCKFVSPTAVTDEFLQSRTPGATHFVYGVECNSDGLPAIQKIVNRGFKFSPCGGAPVGSYAYENGLALQVLERQLLMQSLGRFAKFEDPGSAEDFLNLCQALETTRDIPGAFVEIGCFRGSSSCMVLDYAQAAKIDRRFYFFDTFDGFSYPEAAASSDAMWQGTHQTEGYDIVAQRIQDAGTGNVEVHRANIITDQLPAAITQIAVANVDVDLYDAVKVGLQKVAPLIPPGGIIICEDAGHTPNLIGARLALHEFKQSEQGKRFTQIFMTSGQAFLVAHR
ncbi:MAG TPA: TylF/MycF/NovP-related O-methyltransferase [Opitutaceae bacterium]|nr:TylF/MycF/NovP-related O-methyltransferase [Opitutaceae bacterium]